MSEHIPNSEPNIITENAIGMAYTPQQKSIGTIKNIDLERVTAKKSNAKKGVSKPSYSRAELEEFAKQLGISIKGLKKADLVLEIRTLLLDALNEEEIYT